MLYLDEAASAPLSAEALRHHVAWLEQGIGNPASVHEAGESMRTGLEGARKSLAASLACDPSRIVFTSGGTEANAMAIFGVARAVRERDAQRHRILVSAVEHSSTLDPAEELARIEGFELDYVPVDHTGRLRVEALETMLDEHVALVAVMAVNNEIGARQPLERVQALAGSYGARVVCDAVATPVTELAGLVRQCDAVTLSGHKFGGPQGTGALVLASDTPWRPLMAGSQESGRRAGTPNTAGLIGMAAALTERAEFEERAQRTAAPSPAQQLAAVVAEVAGDAAQVTGPVDPALRSPWIASFIFPGISGEALLIELGHRGLLCSSGSACHADSTDPSHVLTAMGLESSHARTAVRMSVGRALQPSELDSARSALRGALAAFSDARPKQ